MKKSKRYRWTEREHELIDRITNGSWTYADAIATVRKISPFRTDGAIRARIADHVNGEELKVSHTSFHDEYLARIGYYYDVREKIAKPFPETEPDTPETQTEIQFDDPGPKTELNGHDSIADHNDDQFEFTFKGSETAFNKFINTIKSI